MSTSSAEHLTNSYPAVAGSVPEARREICALATRCGATPETVDAIRLAASEALTNAILHAYREEPGMVHVTAAVVSGEMWLLIADEGCGLHAGADRPGLGLGLAMIAHVADDLTVGAPSTGGVELTMRFDLVRRSGRATQPRGSDASARRPASARFSTTV